MERIGKAGAKFDIQKAQWYNQQYLRAKPDDELADYLLNDLSKHNISCEKEKAIKICNTLKERVTFPHEFWDQGKIFFIAPTTFDETITSKKWSSEVANALRTYIQTLNELDHFDATNAKSALETVAASLNLSPGKVLPGLRLCITGGSTGPDLMLTLEIIGKEETISRIAFALGSLNGKA